MKVLNFGSLNMDYVYDVPHFVQPGETISSSSRSVFAGGKGLNQSVALAKAGAETYHAGCVGYDGDILKEILADAGVNTEYILEEKNEQSGHTIIQVEPNGQNCIIVFGGTNHRIMREQGGNTLENFSRGDFLLLQNEINGLDYLIREAHMRGLRIVLNPSPIDESIAALPLSYVEFFIVNEIEGMQLAQTKEIEEIIPRLAGRYPQAKIVLTLGIDGARYYDGEREFQQPAYPVEAIDTTAAGDTFLGYFIAGMAKGIETQQTLKIAARASSITVAHKGAADSIPTLDEVLARGL